MFVHMLPSFLQFLVRVTLALMCVHYVDAGCAPFGLAHWGSGGLRAGRSPSNAQSRVSLPLSSASPLFTFPRKHQHDLAEFGSLNILAMKT